MPRLWNSTIETHRAAVREAIVDATAQLVAERGLLAVNMSVIAEQTGIGRATLYKYFPDVQAILLAWHDREVNAHLDHLGRVRDRGGDARHRLAGVLEAYALIAYESGANHDTELSALLHRGDHVAHAEHHLHDLIADLLADDAEAGNLRNDVAPDELATYCVHALSAARGMASKAAVRRLVTVVLAGLRSP